MMRFDSVMLLVRFEPPVMLLVRFDSVMLMVRFEPPVMTVIGEV